MHDLRHLNNLCKSKLSRVSAKTHQVHPIIQKRHDHTLIYAIVSYSKIRFWNLVPGFGSKSGGLANIACRWHPTTSTQSWTEAGTNTKSFLLKVVMYTMARFWCTFWFLRQFGHQFARTHLGKKLYPSKSNQIFCSKERRKGSRKLHNFECHTLPHKTTVSPAASAHHVQQNIYVNVHRMTSRCGRSMKHLRSSSLPMQGY